MGFFLMQIASLLLVLAVSAQVQFFVYGAVPAVPDPFAYGYSSYIDNQYHALDELGQASFGLLAPDRPPATSPY